MLFAGYHLNVFLLGWNGLFWLVNLLHQRLRGNLSRNKIQTLKRRFVKPRKLVSLPRILLGLIYKVQLDTLFRHHKSRLIVAVPNTFVPLFHNVVYNLTVLIS